MEKEVSARLAATLKDAVGKMDEAIEYMMENVDFKERMPFAKAFGQIMTAISGRVFSRLVKSNPELHDMLFPGLPKTVADDLLTMSALPGKPEEQDWAMDQIFLQRQMELGGDEVVVRFGRPFARENDFCCDYEIAWLDQTRVSRAFGIDAVQALLLAMAKAHVDMLASAEAKRGELRWLGSPDLGLPLPDGVTTKDFE